MGRSFFIGASDKQCIKLDLFYTDPFIRPSIIRDGIRLASMEDMSAMKMKLIVRGGRKKDFWDVHELLEKCTLNEMLNWYQTRYPYSYESREILTKLADFEGADHDFDPLCLKGKHWELIKLDIYETVQAYYENKV